MISRKLKALYYALTEPFMYLSGRFYKYVRSPKQWDGNLVKVHLGPGQKNYLKGWINVDANIVTAKVDVWADLRHSLPFRNASVDCFYSHHVIEHLPNLKFHFEEMFRCLKPGGHIRVGGPNGDSAIHKFVTNHLEWFDDFPDKRESIGGRFENFIFCRQEHLTILTYSYLEELLTNAGFVDVRRCLPVKETKFADVIDGAVLSKEWESDFDMPHTLIVEASKT